MPATVWKGYVSFGLVSFPIQLTAAARPKSIHFHLLHNKDLSRVKEVFYCALEDKPVERSNMVKGYEYKKGHYIVIGEEELKKIAPGTAQEMKILQFVRSDEIDPIYLEKSYYVAPGKAGTRPYELLRRVMEQTGYDAVAKIAMHGREHIVVLRPRQDGLLLHTMYFSDELNQANQREREAPEDFSKKELELANTLIDGLKSEFKPEEYQDEFRHNVERLIDQKQKGRKVTSIRQPKPAVVTDLMSALEASLRQASGSGAGSKGEADSKRAKKRAGKAA
jgi:DNA end-binding protein Ku